MAASLVGHIIVGTGTQDWKGHFGPDVAGPLWSVPTLVMSAAKFPPPKFRLLLKEARKAGGPFPPPMPQIKCT